MSGHVLAELQGLARTHGADFTIFEAGWDTFTYSLQDGDKVIAEELSASQMRKLLVG